MHDVHDVLSKGEPGAAAGAVERGLRLLVPGTVPGAAPVGAAGAASDRG
ncbi:hypothetical protein GCM10009864_33530 [Streptomyces lunalinharesii]|uniref:Uncharacterized protein n=1 Tax=Streptomyces lunalinharesii TaxID=333384 RepID=A0ABN3RWZ6_9ACTN